MFISIIKELLGTKIAEAIRCIKIMPHINSIIDDEYESSNIASQKEIVNISGNINLKHTRYS